MSPVRYIDRALIEAVLNGARSNPRLRKNVNFHEDARHPCQRLINAVLPDAYIRPHRHLDPNKAEMLVILRGRLGLIFFDAAGTVTERALLEAGGARLAVSIPPATFHTAVAFDEGAVVFEAKAGPYVPHALGETAEFAPPEGTPEGQTYLARLKGLFSDA